MQKFRDSERIKMGIILVPNTSFYAFLKKGVFFWPRAVNAKGRFFVEPRCPFWPKNQN